MRTLIATVTLSLLATTAAFAADTPAPAPSAAAQPADSKPVLLASAATAGAATGASAAAAVTAVTPKTTGRSRDEVKAEAVEAVRNHRSTMSQQYDLLK